MAIFSDSEQLYATLQTLFTRMESENPAAAESLLKSRLWIRLNCSEPTAFVMFDARKRPLQITYGAAADKRADLDVAIVCNALHDILLGDLRLAKAVGSGQLKPNGPVWKVTALADLFHAAQAIYPTVAQEQGLI